MLVRLQSITFEFDVMQQIAIIQLPCLIGMGCSSRLHAIHTSTHIRHVSYHCSTREKLLRSLCLGLFDELFMVVWVCLTTFKCEGLVQTNKGSENWEPSWLQTADFWLLASPAPRSKALVEEVRQKHVQSEREKLRAKRRCKILDKFLSVVQVGTSHINFHPV